MERYRDIIKRDAEKMAVRRYISGAQTKMRKTGEIESLPGS